jgi:hypothetical protein
MFFTMPRGDHQEEVISITGFSLAFRTVTMFSVSRRSFREAPFKCPDEARRMLISNAVGDFLHAHVAARKQVCCSLKSLLV